MVVTSIEVREFRNLADGRLGLGPGLNLLRGPNGAGKTNLLEATYMALAGRSCRTRDDRETIRFGSSLSRAEARVVGASQERAVHGRDQPRRGPPPPGRRPAGGATRPPSCARRSRCSCPTGWP